MKLSTKSKYGLAACVILAGEYDNYMSISSLAAATGVSEGYLEQILAMLKRNGLIETLRGASGGYRLSASPADITIGMIVRAAEDNLQIVDCVTDECDFKCGCSINKVWTRLYNSINKELDSINLMQMIEGKV